MKWTKIYQRDIISFCTCIDKFFEIEKNKKTILSENLNND